MIPIDLKTLIQITPEQAKQMIEAGDFFCLVRVRNDGTKESPFIIAQVEKSDDLKQPHEVNERFLRLVAANGFLGDPVRVFTRAYSQKIQAAFDRGEIEGHWSILGFPFPYDAALTKALLAKALEGSGLKIEAQIKMSQDEALGMIASGVRDLNICLQSPEKNRVLIRVEKSRMPSAYEASRIFLDKVVSGDLAGAKRVIIKECESLIECDYLKGFIGKDWSQFGSHGWWK